MHESRIPVDESDDLLVPGMNAPDFEAPVVGAGYPEGSVIRLSDLRGSHVVLYFYPKDDTPGCTAQACGLRDRWASIVRPNTHFFGVSVDSIESHKKFIEKFDLPFPLITDASHEIAGAYGVWVEKSMYGKTFWGTERSTFVVRPDGRIKSVFRKVKPADHADMIHHDLLHLES